MLEPTLWGVGATAVGGYVLLFMLARRPVTLRLARIGGLLAGIVGLRLVLTVGSGALPKPLELTGIVLVGAVAAALLGTWRVWLVRATAEELRKQIQTACQGLFLDVQEPRPGRLQLAVRGQPTVHLRRLAPRVQLLVLCRVTGPGKAALLCTWLMKQLPGPVPRLRIVLKGGAQ